MDLTAEIESQVRPFHASKPFCTLLSELTCLFLRPFALQHFGHDYAPRELTLPQNPWPQECWTESDRESSYLLLIVALRCMPG